MPRANLPFLRHFVGLLVPLLVVVAAVAFAWQGQERRLYLDGLRRSEQTRVTQEARILEIVLASRAVDASFLADRVARDLETHKSEAIGEIADTLWTFSFLKSGYVQVRFLDAHGRERVRLQRNADGIQVLEGKDLRDRSAEPTFQKAAAIPFGQIYVSRLELRPGADGLPDLEQPVLRFASPVLGPDFALAGVVILDLNGDLPLARLRMQRSEEADQLALVNPQGFWLLGPRPNVEWGFQLPERRGFTLDWAWPGAWDILRRRDHGQFLLDGALYTYATARADAPAGMGQAVRIIPEEGWTIVSRLDPERLVPPQALRFLSLTGGLLVLLVVGVWFYAQAQVRRAQATAALRRSEETARAILDAGPDAAYFLLDPEGVILTANTVAEERFRAAIEGGLTGKDIMEIVPPDLASQRRKLLAFCMQSGESLRFDDRREGMILDNTFYPVKSENGSVESVVLVSRDVTAERAAQDRLLTLSRAVDQSPAMVVITDPQGRIEYVNPHFTEVYGWTLDEIRGKTPRVLKSGQHGAEFYNDLWQTITAGREWRGEVCNKARDGREVWEHMSISPVLDDEGLLTHFVAVKEDVTESKLAADALAESEEKIRAMSEATQDAMVMIDDKGLVVFWNPAAERTFGYAREEVLGHKLHELVTMPQDLDKAKSGFPAFTASGEGQVVGAVNEFQGRRKDGSVFPVELRVSSFRLRGRWWAVGTARDITDRKLVENKLREMATTDGLTGALNRRRLMELGHDELERSRRYDRPLGLIMFDVDHFKKVNDTRGHAAGDEVLRVLTATARETLRGADVLGRIGGEEFAVLLPETDLTAASKAAERLRFAAEAMRLECDGQTFSVTVSLGVVLLNKDESLEDLFKRADQALYRAKEGGRNRVEVG